jgi:hypothetical protein
MRTFLLKAIPFTVCLIIVAYFVHLPHRLSPLPFHVDEWHHLEKAKRLYKGDRYDMLQNAVYGLGFHLSHTPLFIIEEVVDIEAVYLVGYLPALYAILAAAILFLLVNRLTGDYKSALFSMIFFTIIPSNDNLHGHWYAVPSTLSIAFMYLTVYLFMKALQKTENKNILAATASLAITGLIHPSTAVVVAFICGVYIWWSKNRWHKKMTWFFTPIALAYLLLPIIHYMRLGLLHHIVDGVFYTLYYPTNSGGMDPTFTQYPVGLTFIENTIPMSRYFIPYLYGLTPTIFAIIGLLVVKRTSRAGILIPWAGITFAITLLFEVAGFSILARRQHILFY